MKVQGQGFLKKQFGSTEDTRDDDLAAVFNDVTAKGIQSVKGKALFLTNDSLAIL